MIEIVNVGEKGQIVIPKKLRDEFKIEKGSKLLITEDKGKIIIKPINLDKEKYILMSLSESSLKEVWNNKYDERWDDVL